MIKHPGERSVYSTHEAAGGAGAGAEYITALNMSLTFGTGQIIGCAMRQSCATLTKRVRHANYSERAALSQRCSECQPSQLCDVTRNNVTPATKNSCSVKIILFFTTHYSYCKVRYLQIVSPWKVKCRRLDLNIRSQF